MTMFSGPMFERKEHPRWRSVHDEDGAHYNVFAFNSPEDARIALKEMFPEGQANEYNLAVFSTSGIHGMYTTIEEIEAGFAAYPDGIPGGQEWPDDYPGDELTVSIYHPRIVCLRYGNMKVLPEDIEWLKKLRASSNAEFCKLGGQS